MYHAGSGNLSRMEVPRLLGLYSANVWYFCRCNNMQAYDLSVFLEYHSHSHIRISFSEVLSVRNILWSILVKLEYVMWNSYKKRALNKYM